MIEPLVKLAKGTIKQKVKNDRVDIFLDIPFCAADENFFVNLQNSNHSIKQIKKDPLLLTNNRKVLMKNHYIWGSSDAESKRLDLPQKVGKKSSFKRQYEQKEKKREMEEE